MLEGHADAVLAASVFHYGELSVGAVKAHHGVKVDRTALLELRDLAVRDAAVVGELASGEAGAGRQFPP